MYLRDTLVLPAIPMSAAAESADAQSIFRLYSTASIRCDPPDIATESLNIFPIN